MMKTASRVTTCWLLRLGVTGLLAISAPLAGCSQKDQAADPGLGPGVEVERPDGSCDGGPCPAACAKKANQPGCPCDFEGQHLFCAEVQTNIGGQAVCGTGFSVCTGGVWAPCIITGATLTPSSGPDGFWHPQNLGQPTPCTNNPCNPTCTYFPDTPTGLGNADAGLVVSDAGLTLAGEGGSSCVPTTCADQGANCGPLSDKCGGLLQCGACNAPATCGGDGTPNVCGIPANCTNLCLQQVGCIPKSTKTTLTGKVYAPNGIDPLPNAVVYVPNAAVDPFPPGVACEQCGETSGSPLVSVLTDVNGTFTLQNVPATDVAPGKPIPLVIQVGRWRRQVTINNVPRCQTTTVPASLSRLPRNKTEGDIPKIAFSTGRVDVLECMFRKIGIADSEFTIPSGTGRVNFFAGRTAPGTYIGGVSATQTPWEADLMGDHWALVPPMAGARVRHVAARLTDGKVLVAGGASAANSGSLRTVEVYDPVANSWTTKAQMGIARTGATATILTNGKVLVAGGVTYPSTYLSSAEVYDPVANTWTATGAMTGGVGRVAHTATLLNTGKVLVVGGSTNGSAATNSTTSYDPGTNAWTAAASLSTARFQHTATLLSDGRLLVAGGHTGSGVTASAERYNPPTNAWSGAGSMTSARREAVAARIPANNRVIVAGGNSSGSGSTSVSTSTIYNPSTNSWSSGPGMAASHQDFDAVVLPDNTILVAGGYSSAAGGYIGVSEFYDAALNAWRMPDVGHVDRRGYHTMTLLTNGRVLAAGGYNGSVLSSAELSGSPALLNNYNMILFPCQGEGTYSWPRGLHRKLETNLSNYVEAGGRVFATHYNYSWLYNDNVTFFSNLSGSANWNFGQSSPGNQSGYIVTSFPKGKLLADWLFNTGQTPTYGRIALNTLRRDFNSVIPPSQNWVGLGSQTGTQIHFTFNAPIGAQPAQQCGRVVYSDFHVFNSGNSFFPFPTECSAGAMTPQERLLEFMLFDLASCIQPDQIGPHCTPLTCAQQGLNCGQAGDGCGNTIDCGTCTAPATCGGGGDQGVCGVAKVYNDGYFVRDYDASSVCPPSATPVWRLWSWSTITPTDTHIDFTVQTATTQAGLDTAPADQVLFSNPPGPASLMSTVNWAGLPVGSAVAHGPNLPSAGMPDTQLGSCSLDYTFATNGRSRSNKYVRVKVHFAPSSNKFKAPTLAAWDMQIDCPPSQ